MDEKFTAFLNTVDPRFHAFTIDLNELLLEHGYKFESKEAKSGYVISYIGKKSKRTLLNCVFRKAGMILRLYPTHLGAYEDFVSTLPDSMKQEIHKGSVCKRLVDPSACNSRCPMGYTFTMDGEQQIKCRYSAFFFLLNEESAPYLRQFVEKELAAE